MAVESWYAAFADWVNQFPTSYPPKWDARRFVIGAGQQGPVETINDSSGETFQIAEPDPGRPRFRETPGAAAVDDILWSEQYPEEYGFPQGFIFQSPQTANTHWWNFNPALADNPIFRYECWNGPSDNKQDHVYGQVTLPTEGSWQSPNSLDINPLSGFSENADRLWACVAGIPSQSLVPGFPEDRRRLNFAVKLSVLPSNIQALFVDPGNYSYETTVVSLHFVDPPEFVLAPSSSPAGPQITPPLTGDPTDYWDFPEFGSWKTQGGAVEEPAAEEQAIDTQILGFLKNVAVWTADRVMDVVNLGDQSFDYAWTGAGTESMGVGDFLALPFSFGSELLQALEDKDVAEFDFAPEALAQVAGVIESKEFGYALTTLILAKRAVTARSIGHFARGAPVAGASVPAAQPLIWRGYNALRKELEALDETVMASIEAELTDKDFEEAEKQSQELRKEMLGEQGYFFYGETWRRRKLWVPGRAQ